MLYRHGIGCLAVLVIVAAGCGKSDVASERRATPTAQDQQAAANAVPKSAGSVDHKVVADTDTPEAAVRKFLESLRTGDEDTAVQLLSTVAREKNAGVQHGVTPPASDTASFTIDKVEQVNDDGARVFCTWTDVDEEQQRRSDEAIWVVRREPEGWRIAGVAAQVFPDEPPLLLNFEDPSDMSQKQQWVREEIRRRTESGIEVRTEVGENPEKPVRR